MYEAIPPMTPPTIVPAGPIRVPKPPPMLAPIPEATEHTPFSPSCSKSCRVSISPFANDIKDFVTSITPVAINTGALVVPSLRINSLLEVCISDLTAVQLVPTKSPENAESAVESTTSRAASDKSF